eukprot:CAMPEP_0119307974 /NCGR_PEP_ID=MMETSP1333-20130426/8318_1 /TAXON_ID=418940 /ORGANISM="Scyphosphaera apsteinii, Strain RCC1455" /LENGTH=286 /DNA_ID=CAMNT_0007311637 /DNA_START=103 /DNA_END=963 /DNA_ORIENTATION=+
MPSKKTANKTGGDDQSPPRQLPCTACTWHPTKVGYVRVALPPDATSPGIRYSIRLPCGQHRQNAFGTKVVTFRLPISFDPARTGTRIRHELANAPCSCSLHHVSSISAARARKLLQEGAQVHEVLPDGDGSSPFMMARALQQVGAAQKGTAAYEVLKFTSSPTIPASRSLPQNALSLPCLKAEVTVSRENMRERESLVRPATQATLTKCQHHVSDRGLQRLTLQPLQHTAVVPQACLRWMRSGDTSTVSSMPQTPWWMVDGYGVLHMRKGSDINEAQVQKARPAFL